MGMPSDQAMINIWKDQEDWKKKITNLIQIFSEDFERVRVAWQPLQPLGKRHIEKCFFVKKPKDIERILLEIEKSFEESWIKGIRVNISGSWCDHKRFS